MGHYNNTDNLGIQLKEGDHVGYIYGFGGHYRIHSGTVEKLCEKRVWVKPDEVFETDVENKIKAKQHFYPDYIPSKYRKLLCLEYGKVVKIQ